jgi:hypothetical protein
MSLNDWEFEAQGNDKKKPLTNTKSTGNTGVVKKDRSRDNNDPLHNT